MDINAYSKRGDMNIFYSNKCFCLLLWALILAPVSSTFGGDALGEDEEVGPSVSAQVDVFSAYMFRGQDLFNGTSLQPAVNLGYSLGGAGSLSASAWSHLSIDHTLPAENRFSEVDYTLSYSIGIDALTLGAGHVWYTFPDNDDELEDTAEWFASIGVDTVLSPTLTYYRDYDLVKANFFVLGVSHEIGELGSDKGISLTPYANTTFVDDAEGLYDDDGFANITLGVTASFELAGLDVTPGIHYNFKIDDSTTNKLWLGMSFAFSS